MNINILTDAEVSRLKEVLASSFNIVICCHKSPDGDAVGASLAWAHFLKQWKTLNPHPSTLTPQPSITVVLPDAAPDFLHWMPGFNTQVMRYDKKPEEVRQRFAEADLVCCMDFNTASRTEDLQEVLDACGKPKLLIDHHLQPDIDTVMSVSRPEMSSTCEIVFDLIWQFGGYETMSPECAQCLYAGMMTDTGGFTYNSSRPEIYYVVSLLLAKGINKDKIYNRVYHNYSISCIRLRSYVIYRKMQVVAGLHAAYFSITKEEMKRFHFQRGDAEGLVNEPLKIKGLKLSISLREDTERPNLILVSLRSSCGFHCEKMARQFFNGGGHEDAAGGKLYCSIADAEQIALKAIMAYQAELRTSR